MNCHNFLNVNISSTLYTLLYCYRANRDGRREHLLSWTLTEANFGDTYSATAVRFAVSHRQHLSRICRVISNSSDDSRRSATAAKFNQSKDITTAKSYRGNGTHCQQNSSMRTSAAGCISVVVVVSIISVRFKQDGDRRHRSTLVRFYTGK